MSVECQKIAVYDDLYTIPDTMIGQIIGGELFAMPRPSPRHAQAASILGIRIGGPFYLGEGGPGGWLILDEPEIQLDSHTFVPDIAGWKKERLGKIPETNWISVVPDWICEVLSPGTARIDKKKKMPIYAQFGVPYLWLVDPLEKTLEIFRLDNGNWLVAAVYSEDDIVRAEPFQAIEINLSSLWS